MTLLDRRPTRKIFKGKVAVGGGAPVSVQSMTKTSTEDVEATASQIRSLLVAGCDIIRLAVPSVEAAEALSTYKEQFEVPLIADIHFDHKLALRAIEAGADGLRINPGNIGSSQKVEAVAKAAADRKLPIRVGVNSGSLPKRILQRHGHTAAALVESARQSIGMLEQAGFQDIVVSMKSTDVALTVEAYRIMSSMNDYPFHLGITESGIPRVGAVRSAVGIGALLAGGVGDTIRVSLTGDPVHEVATGLEILKALGLRRGGPTLVSCPTCGRCKIDIVPIAEKIEEAIQDIREEIKIAVMGCEVNGPGEARAADVGIAGGGSYLMIFREGKPVRRVHAAEAVDCLIEEINAYLHSNKDPR